MDGMDKDHERMSDAISRFSRKFARFMKAPEDERAIRAEARDSVAEERIKDADDAFVSEVARKYSQYKFPYKTFGEDSVVAKKIDGDERALEAAWNLFKAADDAREKFCDDKTFFKDSGIVTPLAQKLEYTKGDDFVYLRCWLELERKVEDFAPQFESRADKSIVLRFVPAAAARLGRKQKAMAAAIKAIFGASEERKR